MLIGLLKKRQDMDFTFQFTAIQLHQPVSERVTWKRFQAHKADGSVMRVTDSRAAEETGENCEKPLILMMSGFFTFRVCTRY